MGARMGEGSAEAEEWLDAGGDGPAGGAGVEVGVGDGAPGEGEGRWSVSSFLRLLPFLLHNIISYEIDKKIFTKYDDD